MHTPEEILQIRQPGHGVDSIFPLRWSPRAMSGDAITHDELMTLFEAARWAPSSYNNQPWRFMFAMRDTANWELFFGLMGQFNQSWARNAAALIVVASSTVFAHNGKPSRTHSFDTGAAWGTLALQGSMQGLVVHCMQGFDYDAARARLGVPPEWDVEAMIAVGRQAEPASLPENLRSREHPSTRNELATFVMEGTFKDKP